jgi:hypothetical protein
MWRGVGGWKFEEDGSRFCRLVPLLLPELMGMKYRNGAVGSVAAALKLSLSGSTVVAVVAEGGCGLSCC